MWTLDIGCGEKKRGMIGVDKKKTSVVDVVCDAHYLPFQNDFFDKVFAYAVLEHVDNPVQVLKEVNRVLRRNGEITVLVPKDSLCRSDYVSDFFSLNFRNMIRMNRLKGGHKWQYTEASLRKLLSLANFKPVKTEEPASPWIWGRKGRVLTKMGIMNRAVLIIKAEKRQNNVKKNNIDEKKRVMLAMFEKCQN